MMNSQQATKFTQAIAFAQAGQLKYAHFIFRELDSIFPNQSNILLWLAYTASGTIQSETLLNQLATLDPYNPHLGEAYSWLSFIKLSESYRKNPQASDRYWRFLT